MLSLSLSSLSVSLLAEVDNLQGVSHPLAEIYPGIVIGIVEGIGVNKMMI